MLNDGDKPNNKVPLRSGLKQLFLKKDQEVTCSSFINIVFEYLLLLQP